MALTRKMLTALGIEDAKIEQIIDAHTETVNGLKDEISELKDKSGSADDVQKKLEASEKKVAELQKQVDDGKNDSYKEKYDTLAKEYKDYKTQVDTEKSHSAKETIYRNLLKEAGVSEKRIDSIIKLKSADIDNIKVGKDGNIDDPTKVKDDIKTEWADFIVEKKDAGTNPANPPVKATPVSLDAVKSMSIDEINKNWDSIKDTLKSAKGE
jgi:chromosome segregation ATPase